MSSVDVDLGNYCRDVAANAKHASHQLGTLNSAVKNEWLRCCSTALVAREQEICDANAMDIAAAPEYGLTDAAVDRLRLDAHRIAGIASALGEIASLPDPIGQTIEGHRRPNGLEIRKVRVPLGTVFFIYESRPNVTADAAAICVKSGNAVILRGGKEAIHSSQAIVDILQQEARKVGLPEHAVQMVNTTDRAAVGHFLKMSEQIDVVIPRGGKGLIERVAQEATMPVIKHFDGNCHVFVDQHADLQMAIDIVVNSKCQRMGVCNACESLLIHREVASSHLPAIASALEKQGIELRGDAEVCQLVNAAIAATDEDWGTEYLGPTISIGIVADIEEAITHINRYSSKHTEAIVTSDLPSADQFCRQVDSSAVIVNASTRFNDGGEFGLGAEIGISTDKFHARGPCGLQELTTYKYLVSGNGQTR